MKKLLFGLGGIVLLGGILTSCGNESLEVNVYMPSPSGLNENYISQFEEETGINVNLFEGTTGEILARLESEKDNPIADVVVLASWSDGLNFKENNELLSFNPKNSDKLYDGWKDNDNTLFGTSASALGVIYNTNVVASLDADWSDFSKSEYKDLICIPDGAKSGSFKDFMAGYMYAFSSDRNNLDYSTWKNIADNGLTIPGANKAALQAVTSGEKGILIGGVDYNAYSSIAKKEAIKIYYPKSGTLINPRPAMVLKSSKNQDNAKKFVEYLLSDNAQELVSNAYLLPGRNDITCTNRTNVSDINQFDIDWEWMRKNSDTIIRTINNLTTK